MSQTSVLESEPKRSKPNVQSKAGRYFHSAAALILLIIMFVGFQQFYLHGRAFPNRPLTPPIRTIVISHGLAMTAWMLLLVVQPLLIVSRKHRLHMTLGKIGAGLAACIVVLGIMVGIQAAKVAPPEVRLWNMPYKQFLAVPIISMLIFAGFIILAIWYRKRPEIHRSMILLGTMAVIPAAADRIEPITSLYRETFFGPLLGPFFSIAVLGGIFLAVKCIINRSFDRYYAIGWIALTLMSAGIMKLALTPAWDSIATFLLR